MKSFGKRPSNSMLMTTILRFFLFFLLAPAFSIVVQAAGTFQDDFRIIDAGIYSESVILDSVDGGICSYDSSGTLLHQRKSINGEDDRNRYGEFETAGAIQPLFAFWGKFVATNRQVSNLRNLKAADVNAEFIAKGQSSPFASGTIVRQFDAASDLNFVRVHNASNPRGGWMVRADEIAGMSPQQIQRHLALPEVPTHIQSITVPRSSTLQMGRVGPQPQWGATTNGGVQYRATEFLPDSAFGPSTQLP